MMKRKNIPPALPLANIVHLVLVLPVLAHPLGQGPHHFQIESQDLDHNLTQTAGKGPGLVLIVEKGHGLVVGGALDLIAGGVPILIVQKEILIQRESICPGPGKSRVNGNNSR